MERDQQPDSPPFPPQPESELWEGEPKHAESPKAKQQQPGTDTTHDVAQQSTLDGREEEVDCFRSLAQQAVEVAAELTDAILKHGKPSYMYEYEGEVAFGLGMPLRPESGMKMKCKFGIVSESEKNFILQISDVELKQMNGLPGQKREKPLSTLTQRYAENLMKPFKFHYENGHVSNIRANKEVPVTVVNMGRAILDFFHLTTKQNEDVYELVEDGIHGQCDSFYAIRDDKKNNVKNITLVVDIRNCKKKAAIYEGMAFAEINKNVKQAGESLLSSMRYSYAITPTPDGGTLERAYAVERQFFSPFSAKGGSFKMHAMKTIKRLEEKVKPKPVPDSGMENKGDLIYQFANLDAYPPFVVKSKKNVKTEAIELIKKLAKDNKPTITNATTVEILRVFQLIRMLPSDQDIEDLWTQLKGDKDHKRWLLNVLVEMNDKKILNFMKKRFENPTEAEMDETEALQTFVVAMNHLKATPDLIKQAEEFLDMEFCKSKFYLYPTVLLSYGSLVRKYCSYHPDCPVSFVEPLRRMAESSEKNSNYTQLVLTLKAIGNAGHQKSLKYLQQFIPGISSKEVNLPTRVVIAAVQSMRLIAARDKYNVHKTLMEVFVHKDLPSEVRMMAVKILMETQPSRSIVLAVTSVLEEEEDINLGHFAYSYMKSLATSWTPDFQNVSISCSLAMKTLAHRYDHLNFTYSNAWRKDIFNYNYLMGTAAEAFMLANSTSFFPNEMMARSESYFFGRVLQMLEVGLRSEGMQDVFAKHIPKMKDVSIIEYLRGIFDMIYDWESLPDNKPAMSVYSQVYGQDWFFANIKKECIKKLAETFTWSARKGSSLWDAIEKLQQRYEWHWNKPFLAFETRYFQASSLGFPLELSKYYQILSGVNVDVKAMINPPLKQSLLELWKADISLKASVSAGYTKDFGIFFGFNTELFQSGAEFKSKVSVAVPADLTAKVNLEKKHYELEIPTCKKESELLTVNSDVTAISRYTEETETEDITPLIPSDETMKPASEMKPNIWHPKYEKCMKSGIYRVGICVRSDMKRSYFHQEYPLYYFLGYTRMAVVVVPVPASQLRDKIIVMLNMDTSKISLSTRQLFESLKTTAQKERERASASGSASAEKASHERHSDIIMEASRAEAIFNLTVAAMNGQNIQRAEGYEITMFKKAETDQKKFELYMSHFGNNAKWKMCLNTAYNHDETQTVAQAQIEWGVECKPYGMTMHVEYKTQDFMPTLETKVAWKEVPQQMADDASIMEKYLPGIAYCYGFNQTCEKNMPKEVSSSIVKSSSDSIDMTVKLPEGIVDGAARVIKAHPSLWSYPGLTVFLASVVDTHRKLCAQARDLPLAPPGLKKKRTLGQKTHSSCLGSEPSLIHQTVLGGPEWTLSGPNTAAPPSPREL
ncbi:vitellogenin 3, phosvitinless [Pholidichthys leucotaenia]